MKRARGRQQGLTLVELLISAMLVGIVLAIASGGSMFLTSQIDAAVERQSIHVQVDSAFEDMKMRCISASSIDPGSLFSTAGGNNSLFRFNGEADIYTITPDDISDNVNYQYYITAEGDLVLRIVSTAGTRELMLVEKKFQPTLQFTYTPGDEPNVITVTITAQIRQTMMGRTQVITKNDAIRFWFVNAVG